MMTCGVVETPCTWCGRSSTQLAKGVDQDAVPSLSRPAGLRDRPLCHPASFKFIRIALEFNLTQCVRRHKFETRFDLFARCDHKSYDVAERARMRHSNAVMRLWRQHMSVKVQVVPPK